MNLEILHLEIETKDHKQLLKNFCLSLHAGEVHAIMGPNGTGKSTLSRVIMGSQDYKIISGDMIANNQSLLPLATDERARLGIFLAMQNPTSIEGVTNSEFLKTALSNKTGKKVGLYEFMKWMDQGIQDLKMDEKMMHRSINQDFSGGERKKNEILQMKLLTPSLLILDELDSGLDVDSLRIVCDNINQYRLNYPDTTILMITHYPRILEYIRPNFVHMMMNGAIVKTGTMDLAFEIEKNGYSVINTMGETIENE